MFRCQRVHTLLLFAKNAFPIFFARSNTPVLVRAAILIGLVFVIASCKTTASTPEIPDRSAPVFANAQPRDDALADLLERERTRQRNLNVARTSLDKQGLSNNCARFEQAKTTEEVGPRASWLQVWCALRTNHWQAVLARAPRAIAYFEVSGELRRLVEVHLSSALAAHHLEDLAERERHIARAEELLFASRQPLTGGLRDRDAGDLPYLIARLLHLGVAISLPHDPVDPARLLELARFEYASTGRAHAIPHVWRAHAELSLDRGELSNAAAALSSAIEHDHQSMARGGMLEDLILFSSLARVSGANAWADASIDWLFVHEHGALVLGRIEEAVVPTGQSQLRYLVSNQQGRMRILRAVRSIRRDPKTALHPPEDMLELFRELEELSLLEGSSWEIAQEIGLMFAELGEPVHARRYLEHAVEQVEAMRRSIPDLQQRQRFFQDKRDLYMALVHGYVGIDTARLTQEDYRAALELSARIKARGMLDLLDGHRFTAPQQPREPIYKLADLPIDRALGEVAGWLARWERDAVTASPETIASPQASNLALPKGVILLEYLLTDRSGYVWVVTSDGTISMRRIAGRRVIAPLLADFRETLVDHDYDRDDFSRHRELSERLYVELIGPVQDLIVGANKIYLAPDDILHELAFEALARPSRERIPDYMVRSHTLQYIPSSRVLAKLQQRAASSAPSKDALLLGAPALDQSAVNLLAMARKDPAKGVSRLSSLFPELPGSARELDNVERSLRKKGMRPEKHTHASATETAMRTRGEHRYRLVHIAAHGISDAPRWRTGQPELEVEQPALLLARDAEAPDDGIWRLDEILSHGVSARLVVLSGCTTGRGWRTLGDGAYGLGGAFLSNGSQAVMASLWSVSDDATTELMTRVYNRLDDSADDAPEALRRAQLDILRARYKSSPYVPPFYWAAFRVIGI